MTNTSQRSNFSKIQTKTCYVCKLDLSLDKFYQNKASKDNRMSICKACDKEKRSKFTFGKFSATEKRRRILKQLKKEAMEIFGNQCEQCKFSNMIALQFHHDNGNNGEETAQVYRKIVIHWKQTGNRIDGYTLLCSNCHIIHHSKVGRNR